MHRSRLPLLSFLAAVFMAVGIFGGSGPVEAGRVPHDWPDGWSGLQQLGRVSRFVPRLRVAPQWESEVVHLLWVADSSDGDATALAYCKLDLSMGQTSLDPVCIYSAGDDVRITGFDFAPSKTACGFCGWSTGRAERT